LREHPLIRQTVLGIDTCTRWLNLALIDGTGEVLAEVHEEVPTHATKLVAGIDTLLTEGGTERRALAALGVVLGPGSFTGLRVGLAAAEGLSAALGLPVHGLDSLTALALCSAGDGEGLALLDARRGQVYSRRFLRDGGKTAPLGGPEARDPRDLLEIAEACSWSIGDGVGLVPGWAAGSLLETGIPNLAVPAARAALGALGAGSPPAVLTPLYVRPPDVREPGEKEPKSWGAGELEKTRR
jgi:tRNA threonylcarbamoyladenosine biosynthesis protein TsaB